MNRLQKAKIKLNTIERLNGLEESVPSSIISAKTRTRDLRKITQRIRNNVRRNSKKIGENDAPDGFLGFNNEILSQLNGEILSRVKKKRTATNRFNDLYGESILLNNPQRIDERFKIQVRVHITNELGQDKGWRNKEFTFQGPLNYARDNLRKVFDVWISGAVNDYEDSGNLAWGDTDLTIDEIEIIGIPIRVQNVDIADVRMREGETNCVLDSLKERFSETKKKGLSNITEERLKEIIGHDGEIGVNCNDLKEIADELGITVYCIDINDKLIFQHRPKFLDEEEIKPKCSFAFVMTEKNGIPHCQLIEKEKHNSIISNGFMKREFVEMDFSNCESASTMEKLNELIDDDDNYSVIFADIDIETDYGLKIRNMSVQEVYSTLKKTREGEDEEIKLETSDTSYLKSFTIKGQKIITGYDDFKAREGMRIILKKKMKCGELFKEGQTTRRMAITLFNQFGIYDNLLSNLNADVWDDFNKYRINPPVYVKESSDVLSFDISKCHTHALTRGSFVPFVLEEVNIPEKFDGVLPLKPGEYYLGEGVRIPDFFWYEQAGPKPYHLVQYLLDEGHMESSNIVAQNLAKKLIPIKPFQLLRDVCFSTEGIKGKDLMNPFIGGLGKKTMSKSKHASTTNEELAHGLATFYSGNADACYLNQIDETFYINTINTKRLHRTAWPIHRCVVADNRIQVLEMCKKIIIPGVTEVIGFKTDCLYIKGPYNELENYSTEIGGIKPPVKVKTLKKYGTYKEPEETETFKYERESEDWKTMEEEELDSFLLESRESLLITGGPGHGKTTALLKFAKNNPTLKILYYMNQNVVELNEMFPNDDQVRTIHSAFALTDTNKKGDLGWFEDIKVVWIDEFSPIPLKYWAHINKLKKKGIQIIVSGDPGQLLAPTPNSPNYDLTENMFFKKLCDFNMVTLTYKEGTSRFDKELKIKVDSIRDHGKVDGGKGFKKDVKVVISKNNGRNEEDENKRKWWNEKILKGLLKQSKNNVMVNGKLIPVGCKIMIKKNYKRFDLFNNGFVYFKSMDDKFIYFNNDKKISLKLFKWELTDTVNKISNDNGFRLGYAFTSYGALGKTFDEHQNINPESMNRNEALVAFSRARKDSQVHYPPGVHYFPKPNYDPVFVPMSPSPIKGSIYLLNHNVDGKKEGYIGQSIQKNFKERANPNHPRWRDGTTEELLIDGHFYKKKNIDYEEQRLVKVYEKKGWDLDNERLITPKKEKKEVPTTPIDEFKIEQVISGNRVKIRVRRNGIIVEESEKRILINSKKFEQKCEQIKRNLSKTFINISKDDHWENIENDLRNLNQKKIVVKKEKL